MTKTELFEVEMQVIECFTLLCSVPAIDAIENLSCNEIGSLRINLGVLSRKAANLAISLEVVKLADHHHQYAGGDVCVHYGIGRPRPVEDRTKGN